MAKQQSPESAASAAPEAVKATVARRVSVVTESGIVDGVIVKVHSKEVADIEIFPPGGKSELKKSVTLDVSGKTTGTWHPRK